MSIRAVWVSVVLFLFTSSMAHANLVASTPGEFSVSSTGAASYSVPIVVPPGTAGVEPKLSLNYSSQGRNGLMGVGWSIGGLSVIHRCPANLVKDGFIDGIDFDDNDRFCLDGQPLIAINGTYGANNTEYRTEINNFSKIISYGTTGNGPSYFKVWTKSGEIMEYGNTSNSLINPPLANGSTQPDAICWLLNKVTDTVGNYMTVTYFEDTSTGENYPERIDYTGNAGLTPYNSVEFTYETRADVGTRYLAGLQMDSTKRLKNITSKEGANYVRKYNLTYTYGQATNRSVLDSIQECDLLNQCITPTNFNWAEGNNTFQSKHNYGKGGGVGYFTGYQYASNQDFHYTGDFDGDGQSDLMYWNNAEGGWQVLKGTSNGFATRENFGKGGGIGYFADYTGFSSQSFHFTGDFDGDGRTDFMYWNNAEGGWQVLKSTGTSFATKENFGKGGGVGYFTGYQYFSSQSFHFTGDFDGDGRTDFMYWNNAEGGWQVLKSTGTSFVTKENFGKGGGVGFFLGYASASNQSFHYTGDFDGDGRTDFMYWNNAEGGWQVLKSTGTSFATKENFGKGGGVGYFADYAGFSSQSFHFTGDFNGDGLTDFMYWNNAEGGWQVLKSTGIAFASKENFGKGGGVGYFTGYQYASNQSFHYIGDFNADGLVDFMYWNNAEGGWQILKNDGVSFRTRENWGKGGGVGYFADYAGFSSQSFHFVSDFDGDALTDFMYWNNGEGGWQTLKSDLVVEAIDSFTNSLNVSINLDYLPITDDTIYTKGSGASFPEIDLQAPMYVVSESRTDNGIGGQNTLTYEYEGARVHVQGRGLLGFSKRTVTDVDTNIVIETNYKQDFPYIGQVESTKTTVNGTLVSEELNTFAALGNTTTGPAFPYVSPSVSKTYDLNGGALLSTVTTTSSYDSYGNPTNIGVTTIDAGIDTYTTTTVNTYTNDLTNWFLGRLTQAVATKTGGAQTSPSRKSTFEYHATTGLLNKEVIEPDDTAFKLTKTYTHDSFGNRISVTESGSGITSRTTTTSYDAKGQFPTTVTNALGHSETREYNDPYGNVTKLTGPNLLDTTWEYDSLGRKSREVRADGTETNISYAFCTSGCPTQVSGLASYKITTTTTGAATSIAYYDAVNRVILTEAQSFDGSSVFVETEYDAQGRVDRKSNPYFGTTAAYWTDYTYDDLGRVTQEASPTTGTTTMSYSGFEASSTNALSQTSTEKSNSIGQTIWTKDNNNKQLDFEYDAQGNLITVTDSENNVTTNTYNLRGFKTQMIDPDMGTWTYSYNVLGELTSQTDAKNQSVSMSYDQLGRLITRTENEGTTTWTYDTATKGIGKLASVSHYGGYSRTHTYDSLGRPSSTTTTIGGTGYTTSTTYDGFGRVDDVSYPSAFKVEHLYNATGYLEKVRNANNISEVFYTALAADQFGNITSQTLGSGAAAITTFRSYQQNSGRIHHIDSVVQDLEYTFNSIGNLTQRKDHDQSALTEDFTYDNLNRLTEADVVGAGTVTFTYDDLGNITNKSDVGNYTYGAGNAGPHAVTSAGGNTYTYDDNGNQISGDGKTLTWSSYNKPTQIQKGSSQSNFTYGPDRARYLQVTTESSTTTTTTYIGGLYEKVETSSTTEEKHFIRAGSQTIAIFTDRSSGTDATEYLHRDHLGSIDTITDENGAIVEKLSFDAFGKRRLSNWSNGLPTIISNNTRGFTGHEMLDAVGLIHMNGRVYDPLLGRFMSADPTLQYPSDMQNYNRYSYVHNNPLSLTDPSGFGFLKSIKKAFKSISRAVRSIGRAIRSALENPYVRIALSIAVGIVTYGTVLDISAIANLGTLGNVIAGAAGGFAGGFVGSGGDLKAAVIGGLTGAAAGFIGASTQFGPIVDGQALITPERVIAHGVVGGAAADAQGGKFGQGFVSSAFTKAVSGKIQKLSKSDPIAGGVAAAVVGGTASKLSGGKFQNGALTSGFQYLYNQVARELAPYGRKRTEAILVTDKAMLRGIGVGPLGAPQPITSRELDGLKSLGVLVVTVGTLGYAPTVYSAAGTFSGIIGTRIVLVGDSVLTWAGTKVFQLELLAVSAQTSPLIVESTVFALPLLAPGLPPKFNPSSNLANTYKVVQDHYDVFVNGNN